MIAMSNQSKNKSRALRNSDRVDQSVKVMRLRFIGVAACRNRSNINTRTINLKI